MAQRRRVAILVVHGIGEQNPFETIDGFTRNFSVAAEAHFGAPFSLVHGQVPRRGQGSWEEWQQSFVALDADGEGPTFEIFEHYWAHRMTGQATLKDVVDWLEQASLFARKYYREPATAEPRTVANAPVLQARLRGLKDSPVNRLIEPGTGLFHNSGYLRILGFGVPLALRVLAYIESSFVPSNAILNFVYNYVLGKARKIVIDYVGDIAVYTQIDRKSKHFGVRQKILLDARLAIETLLSDDRYDGVLIAGHSLGSAIAYDALNRLHTAPPLTATAGAKVDHARLMGLITFGSPLDKISFFFHEGVGEDQWVRRRIIEDLHSFKRKPRPAAGAARETKWTNRVSRNLEEAKIVWQNFYDRNDPIAGHLDVYDATNERVDTGRAFGAAHIGYWDCAEMYARILTKFFGQAHNP